jgi:cytochrome c oxidase subunit 1
MIGARDMAFPKLNALSFWLLAAGGLVVLRLGLLQPARGRLDDVPAARRRSPTTSTGGTDAWIFLIHLTGLSSLVGSINFYATIANMRARGMAGDACRCSAGRSSSTRCC